MSRRPIDSPQRHDRIDALRGLAMVWMTAFHLCFDLTYFGWLHTDFYRDPFWIWQRVVIVSLFLACAGAGQAVALAQQQGWPRFWRRWIQVAGSALLVSVASYVMFPRSFIYFGILHGMAAMLLLTRWLALRESPLLTWGAVALVLPWLAEPAHAAWPFLRLFNAPILNWLGWISQKPITEDYAPLLPWLGVMLWGLAATRWVLHRHPMTLQAPLPAVARPLAWLGRHSLGYYLLHQPVLIGGLWLLRQAL